MPARRRPGACYAGGEPVRRVSSLSIRSPDPVDALADRRQPVVQLAHEMRRQHDRSQIAGGHHGRAAHAAVGEHRELTEAVAGADQVDALAVPDHLRGPLLEHHELVARVALAHDRLAGLRDHFVGEPRELAPAPDRQVLEHADAPEALGALARVTRLRSTALPLVLDSVARDHAIDLDGFAGGRVRIHHEHGRRPTEPGAHLALADVLGRALGAVGLDHPDVLALVKEAVADVAHRGED